MPHICAWNQGIEISVLASVNKAMTTIGMVHFSAIGREMSVNVLSTEVAITCGGEVILEGELDLMAILAAARTQCVNSID